MRLLSTREMADAMGVSESSLKRWVDAGKIVATRTEGGHRRIELAEAMRFIRARGVPILRPDVLDLPEVTAARKAHHDRLLPYLLDGDALGARGWLIARYLQGASIAELADGPIREAMYAIGDLWKHEEAGVFVEHRGTDICLQAVMQLRSMIAAPAASAPVALGGALTGDPYVIPSQLAAMTLTEIGANAVNLGPDTPVVAFAEAAEQHEPKLVWTSVSIEVPAADAKALKTWYAKLPADVTIVVGGQGAGSLGKLPDRVQRVHSMAELAAIAPIKRGRAR